MTRVKLSLTPGQSVFFFFLCQSVKRIFTKNKIELKLDDLIGQIYFVSLRNTFCATDSFTGMNIVCQ